MSTKKCCPKLKKMNLSLLKTRWHLGRRASKNVNKHVPWAPIERVPTMRPGSSENFHAFQPEVNPTTLSYNARVVNFYNSTGSLACFRKQKYFTLLKNAGVEAVN
jgi:hypothetical protein